MSSHDLFRFLDIGTGNFGTHPEGSLEAGGLPRKLENPLPKMNFGHVLFQHHLRPKKSFTDRALKRSLGSPSVQGSLVRRGRTDLQNCLRLFYKVLYILDGLVRLSLNFSSLALGSVRTRLLRRSHALTLKKGLGGNGKMIIVRKC